MAHGYYAFVLVDLMHFIDESLDLTYYFTSTLFFKAKSVLFYHLLV